jgi:small subunit ribosomal protein S21
VPAAAKPGYTRERLRGIHRLQFVPRLAKGGEFPNVSEVKVREGETFESALRRFNKKIKQNGILSEVRRREHYEKPSVRRKRKLVAAKKRRLKAG